MSKALGIGLILGSILVKLPQIIKIVKNKSGEGISLPSVSLDLTAITIYAAYSFVKGFPFSSWGDATFLGIQTVLIAVFVLWYQGSKSLGLMYLIVFIGVCYVMAGGITPIKTLWYLQSFNIPIVVSGKLLQAWTNYKNGHTGQLAAVTLFMLLFGSAARIFTSIQETGDSVVILTYIASTAANAVLVAQLLYYWNVDIKKKAD